MIPAFRRRGRLALGACVAVTLLAASCAAVAVLDDDRPPPDLAPAAGARGDGPTRTTRPAGPATTSPVTTNPVTTGTAPTTTVTTRPATTSTTAPAAPAVSFPNAASTGVPAGWRPRAVHEGDLWVRTQGAVIDGLHVTGSIEVRAHDVTIRNTKVDRTIWNQESDAVQYRGLTVVDTEVGPDTGVLDWGNGAIGTSGYTARRVEIHGVTDGFRVSGDDVRIEDSFVDLAEVPGSCPHLDGVQAFGAGDDVVVRHNTIDARGSCSTSAVFLAEASPHMDLRDNLLLGGAYSIHLNQYEVPTALVVRGNRVVEASYDYGPMQILDSGALTLDCGGNRLVTIDDAYRITAVRGEIGC